MPKKILELELELYTKNGESVLVDIGGSFIYETSVYLYYKNYFSLSNKKYFSSSKPIDGVVGSFFKTKNIQICSELYAAPKQWLIDNEFIRYVIPEKIKKVTNTKSKKDDK